MCKHFIYALVVCFLLTAQERTEPSQPDAQNKKQSTAAQPISTPIENPSPQINNATEAERERERKDRESKDDASKAEQLRQNRIIVRATVWMAIFAGLNLIVASIYAFYARKTLGAIKEQSGHASNQVRAMNDELDVMKKQAAVNRAQIKIAAIAVRAAERNAAAAEQSARIALEEVRPFLTLTANVRRHDTAPEIHVSFQNSGPSQATVFADYILNIFGSEEVVKTETITPFVVYPHRGETARISDIDPRQFDLVVRASGGSLTLKIIGKYEGVGGPYPIAYCAKWVTGRDPNINSIDGKCEEGA